MSDYQLDALGWHQFERLVQSLLKAKISPAIQAWSGSGDHGRDAWFQGTLNFPDPARPHKGPFLFQVKFIEAANAAGARSASGVKSAVNLELGRIDERRTSGSWSDPSCYLLATNAPLSPALRDYLMESLQAALPAATIVLWGASDLDGLLDDSPRTRTAFPQLLGLRDLQALILKGSRPEVLTRSRLELALAMEQAKVFVPTAAYVRVQRVLRDYGFAVLTGPPEVGKTVAARILALALMSAGWDAFETTSPDDIFAFLDADVPQIFVADDAFGSTEYTPARAEEWARNMERLVAATDRTHLIVFTSRPSPLKEALRVLNFQGRARHFPDPARVTVDATSLTRTERALILYRHAKASGMERSVLDFIRTAAPDIVANPQFTPLRIQRLVQDELAAISELPSGARPEALANAVDKGLQSPSSQMRTSFNALTLAHRRILIAMLDASPANTDLANLMVAARRHLPPDVHRAPEDLIWSLDEHFVRVVDPARAISWRP